MWTIAAGKAAPVIAAASSASPAKPGPGPYPQTASELSAGVTPRILSYPPASVDRYGENTAPGTTDMTAAIAAAAAVLAKDGGGTLTFQASTYLVTAPVAIPSNVIVDGHGATIKLSAATVIVTGAFAVSGHDVTFKDLSFDLGVSRLPTYASFPTMQNAGVFAEGAANVVIADCRFANLYTVAAFFHNCKGFVVSGCAFSSPPQLQQLELQHVHVQTCTGEMRIVDNTMINAPPTDVGKNAAGIFVSGTTGPIFIERNTFDYCGRTNAGSHRLGVIDFYGNSVDVHVTSNKATNCINQFMRLASCARVRVHDNYVHFAASAATGEAVINVNSRANFFGVGQVGSQDVQITGNTFINNGDASRICIVLGTYDFVCPSTDMVIADNVFTDMYQCVNTNGPMNSVRIERNTSRSVNGGTIVVQFGSIPITAEHDVREEQSSIDGVSICDNVIVDSGSARQAGILVNFTKNTPYLGRIGQFEVSRNKVTATNGSNAQAISCTSGSGPGQGQLVARGNECTNYKYAFYLRNWNEVTLEDNQSNNAAAAAFLLQQGNRTLNRRGNKIAGGAYAD